MNRVISSRLEPSWSIRRLSNLIKIPSPWCFQRENLRLLLLLYLKYGKDRNAIIETKRLSTQIGSAYFHPNSTQNPFFFGLLFDSGIGKTRCYFLSLLSHPDGKNMMGKQVSNSVHLCDPKPIAVKKCKSRREQSRTESF